MAFTVMNWAGAAFMVGMATALWGAILLCVAGVIYSIWEHLRG